MTTTREYLEKLKAADVQVWAEGDRLRCNAPQGILTPELQAELSSRKPEILTFLKSGSAIRSSLIPIQPRGSRPPFFAVPGHNGDVFCYVRLAHYLGDDQPFYALQPPGFDGECAPFTRITDLAAQYVREVRDFLPGGPYLLGGYCAGGALAFEVAQQITNQGGKVGLFALFDSPFPSVYRYHNQLRVGCRYLLHRIPHHLQAMAKSGAGNPLGYLRDRIRGFSRELWSSIRSVPDQGGGNVIKDLVAHTTLEAVRAYRPAFFPGRIHLFMASEMSLKQNYGHQRDWRSFAGGGLHISVGPDGCTGDNMLRDPYAKHFADRLRECLDLNKVRPD